jgi:hypothetical protein
MTDSLGAAMTDSVGDPTDRTGEPLTHAISFGYPRPGAGLGFARV